MKIGILTFTEGTNIGQRLQNYALQYVLEKEGIETFTIRQKYPVNKCKKFIKDTLFFVLHPKKRWIQNKREKCFKAFNQKYIHFYHKVLPFQGDNRWLAKEFDAFIVGSDQVWSPLSHHVGSNYFLTFAQRQQRLTYAPSLSVEIMPEEKKEKFCEYFRGFDRITVREDRGAQIIKEVAGIDAEVVLDPTMLVERTEWEWLKKTDFPLPEKPYLLTMFLGQTPHDEIQCIAKQTGLEVLEITSSAAVSPCDFIYLVENASVVATDSYHITVFSNLFHRPFVNFIRSNGKNMNSRFDTLYRLLGIENRNWNYLKEHMEEITEMDFSVIDDHLQKERERSMSILKEQLK